MQVLRERNLLCAREALAWGRSQHFAECYSPAAVARSTCIRGLSLTTVLHYKLLFVPFYTGRNLPRDSHSLEVAHLVSGQLGFEQGPPGSNGQFS